MSLDNAPIRVVLAADVLGRAFLGGASFAVMNAWRDARVRPVVTREAVLCYVELLNALGIPDEQVKQWVFWFTHPEKVDYLPEPREGLLRYFDVFSDAASRGNARAVVTTLAEHQGAPVETGENGAICWLSPEAFLLEYLRDRFVV